MADLVVEYWNDKGSELYNSYRFEDIKAFGYVLNREIGMDKVGRQIGRASCRERV